MAAQQALDRSTRMRMHLPVEESAFCCAGFIYETNLGDFLRRCRPSCEAVYGKVPKVGDVVPSFSAAYPYIPSCPRDGHRFRTCSSGFPRVD